ncbi:DUF2029 domain-containing protein [Microbacterium sp. cx-55]|uniref:DUF2029 domain-containing protein n=1 Tax=Microbacterium sp. cx-55 TaxID=2875948 RepID=UPI001CBF1B9A|nr:DUF2029 domain-containing protein [Microbacterium sp. cx-55]MBZ4488703.1 DUF2029 domain-containing protein [Microbacterium sp. cx-55]UGB36058.1 DUF2029 domain-containing protein [Microbacterium sp. cx-55]
MSKRAVLWVAFLIVHLGVSVLGWIMPNEPMGDVYRVYEPWSGAFLNGGYFTQPDPMTGQPKDNYYGFVGITDSWVYPQLALLPMLFTWLFAWAVSYTPAWAITVALLDAVAFAVLVGRGRSTGRNVGAWFWLVFIALMGPVALYRLDAITVPLGIMGCLWLVGRPWLGSILLAVATWIKVWPAALLAAALIAVRRRMVVIGGALLVSVATLAVVFVAGGGRYAFGFIGDQTGRGLQVESPVSTFYLWDAMLGGSSQVFYNPDLLTFEVLGPFVDPVIDIMTPILAIGVGAVALLGAYKAWRGASFAALFPPLALALVTAFIALNKVGSPQYIVWLVVPLVIGLVLDRRRWWGPGILVLVIAACTQIIYPLTYFDLLVALPFPVIVITVRNALLIALAIWSVVLIAKVRGQRRAVPRAAALAT